MSSLGSAEQVEGLVLFVCGATGCGKTAVSIKLAKELGGEIINCDVYQMYKGLSIATAKITEEEMQGVPHHLFSIYDPKQNINVTHFVEAALEVIEKIRGNGNIPIVVGGSNFYLESLLFTDVCPESTSSTSSSEMHFCEMTAAEMYGKLKDLDPEAASIVHPCDSRRVQRALEKCYNIHRLTFTRDADRADDKPTSLEQFKYIPRFPNSSVIHVHIGNQDYHTSLLRQRVNEMVAKGLLHEVRTLYNYLTSPIHSWEEYICLCNKKDPNNLITETETKCGECRHFDRLSPPSNSIEQGFQRGGIAEAIGFKEFFPLFETEVEPSHNTCHKTVSSISFEALLSKTISDIQVSTIRYAKRQSTWIRNRLLPFCQQKEVPVFEYSRRLGEGGASESGVSNTLEKIVMDILHHFRSTSKNARAIDNESNQATSDMTRITLKRKIFYCDVCSGRCFQGKEQYEIHMKSKRHKKREASARKRERLGEFNAQIEDENITGT